VLGRALDERDGQLEERRVAGRGVRQHACLEILLPRAEEHGEEAGHGAVVAVEDPVAAPVEHQTETPGEKPAFRIGHDLDRVHRLAVAEPGAPRAEVCAR